MENDTGRIPRNSKLTARSQQLRRNMTAQERKLWYSFLKRLNLTVKRQEVIGSFIVDFFCYRVKLAIEVDGSQHYEDSELQKDWEREKYFESLGIRVVRYSNADINQRFESVCQDLLRVIQERLPSGEQVYVK